MVETSNWKEDYLSSNDFKKVHAHKSGLWKAWNDKEMKLPARVLASTLAGVAVGVATYLVQDYLNPQDAMDLWLQGNSVSEAEQMGWKAYTITTFSVGAVALGKPVFDKVKNLLQESLPFLKPVKGIDYEKQRAAINALEAKLSELNLGKDQLFLMHHSNGQTIGEIKARADIAEAGYGRNYTYLSEVRGELVLSEYVDGKVKTIAKGDEAIQNWVNDKVEISNRNVQANIEELDKKIDELMNKNNLDASEYDMLESSRQNRDKLRANIVEELDLSEVREQEVEQNGFKI